MTALLCYCSQQSLDGRHVDVYAPSEDFRFSVDNRLINEHVLQQPRDSGPVRFKPTANEFLVGAAKERMPPQVSMACQDGRILASASTGVLILNALC